MGRSTYAETVKNALDVGELEARWQEELGEEEGQDFVDRFNEESALFEYKGWKFAKGARQEYGRLHPMRLKKGPFEVCLVNTHEDANGGAEWYVAFGDDPKAVQQLKKDWGLKGKIAKQDAITQTL